MNKRLSLKILAFGSRITLRRLNELVKSEDIQIAGFSDPTDTLALLEREYFDMVLVDNQADNSDAVLRTTFCFAEAPVAVLLQESTADWRKLRNLPVDGFLPDGVGSTEFLARLKAFLRRKPVYQRVLSPDIKN
jgi:DNA-binding response OmpR family regulator